LSIQIQILNPMFFIKTIAPLVVAYVVFDLKLDIQ
jgi:hypothetical protein